jgi:hypothetical protein
MPLFVIVRISFNSIQNVRLKYGTWRAETF